MVNIQEEYGQFISLVLRLIFVLAFGIGAINKLIIGYGPDLTSWTEAYGTVAPHFQRMFANSWLPAPLVTMQALTLPFVQLGLTLGLLTGYRLKLMWMLSALVMVSLGFGLFVLGGTFYPSAYGNFNLAALSLVGLCFSHCDRFCLGGSKRPGSAIH